MKLFQRTLCVMSLVFSLLASAATIQPNDAAEVDLNDPVVLLSETQSARLLLDSSDRPYQLVRGSAVVGQFFYDNLGRVTEISTPIGSRIFQYDASSKRPVSAWVSKSGSTQPWRMSNGLSESTILDTIATFNDAPLKVLQRVRALVETTMLGTLSESARQLYKNFGSQKARSAFDLLLCETPFTCFACIAFCNRVGDRHRSSCSAYQNVPNAEAQYLDCMQQAGQMELACGLTCL